MIEDIKGMIFERLNDLFLFSLLVLLVGAVGGLFLTKSIRKDILGLEPREIASLYRDRKAVLRSVKEGDYCSRSKRNDNTFKPFGEKDAWAR